MSNRKHIQFHHSLSGTSFTDKENLYHGEPAIGLKPNHEKLFFKNANGDIITISSDELIESLSNAIGVGVSGTTNNRFIYSSELPHISGCTNLNEAVEDTASRALYVTPSIETNLNVAMVDVNGTKRPRYSFDIETDVLHVTLYKMVNGERVELYTGTESRYGGDVTINAIEEEYVLEFIPSDTPNIVIQETLFAYICCTTTTPNEQIDANTVAQLNFIITTDKELSTTITTAQGDYIWFLIPSTLNLEEVTSHNIDIIVDDQVRGNLEATIGSLTCYRTLKQLIGHDWKSRIFLSGIKRGKKCILTIEKGSLYSSDWFALYDSENNELNSSD